LELVGEHVRSKQNAQFNSYVQAQGYDLRLSNLKTSEVVADQLKLVPCDGASYVSPKKNAQVKASPLMYGNRSSMTTC